MKVSAKSVKISQIIPLFKAGDPVVDQKNATLTNNYATMANNEFSLAIFV